MKLFDPDPRLRWLFCMTHPDDEIAVCVWLRRLVLAGAEAHVAWTHATPRREAEAREAARRLGLGEERLTFLPGRDGDVCDQLSELRPLFAELVGAVAPDRVVCGAFEQGHLDHDATNYLVNSAFAGPVLEAPFYHAYVRRIQTLNRFAEPSGEEVLRLSEAERRLKLSFARGYPSQNVWSVLLWYEVWQAARLRPRELARTERLRLQRHRDWRSPNLPEPLAGRVRAGAAWRRWLAALDADEASEPERAQAPVTSG